MQENSIEWLKNLPPDRQLSVFKELSRFLSANELKKVMEQLKRGKDLLTIHRQLGLLHKYQVDLVRIRDQGRF